YEAKSDDASAIKLYNSFASANPNSQLTQKALRNSMQLQFKTGDQIGGAKASIQFASKYPNDKQSIDALTKSAQTFEGMAQLRESADVLMQLASIDSQI